MTSDIEGKIEKDRIDLQDCTNLCIIIVQIFEFYIMQKYQEDELVTARDEFSETRYIDHENLLLHIHYTFVFS